MVAEGDHQLLDRKSTTFIDNMSLPVHSWFRYSAGFSSSWVQQTVQQEAQSKDIKVLDPFAGSGTTLIACEQIGIKSYGYEAQPFIYKIADAKLAYKSNVSKFLNLADTIIKEAKESLNNSKLDQYPDLIIRSYTEDNLLKLNSLKHSVIKHKDNSSSFKLCWLALVSILRDTAKAGTAQWQYIQPNKTKVKVKDAFDAFCSKVENMSSDMMLSFPVQNNQASLYLHDARLISQVEDNSIDLVITSPPYANNYDYGDATRFELQFLGEISSYSELQSKVRRNLVHSCSQMIVAEERKKTYELLKHPILKSIYEEIFHICKEMEEKKNNHGGKKNYYSMIAFYFYDLAQIWIDLRRVAKKGAKVCFVIGDSAPYGVYVPVDKWMGQLAVSAGFNEFYFEKTRDRNIKWKNRKHDVPLKEGRLWVQG